MLSRKTLAKVAALRGHSIVDGMLLNPKEAADAACRFRKFSHVVGNVSKAMGAQRVPLSWTLIPDVKTDRVLFSGFFIVCFFP